MYSKYLFPNAPIELDNQVLNKMSSKASSNLSTVYSLYPAYFDPFDQNALLLFELTIIATDLLFTNILIISDLRLS